MAPQYLIAAHAMELSAGEAAPDWVHLLPFGKFHGRDGRGPWILRDAAHASLVIEATKKFQGQADLPGDFDHQLLFAAQNGRPAPASGWIKQLELRADGLWGRVEWTADAAQNIVDRKYRYISPVFTHDRAGTVKRLRAFALTNMPNLELTALASQSINEPDEDPMDQEAFNALLTALGLSASTTAGDLAAHCQQLDQAAKTTKASLTTIAKSLGLADDATGELLAAAAQDISAKAKAVAPDPAKFVPMTVFKDLQDRVAAMSSQLSGDKASQAIVDAKADGKLSPAMEDWATGYAAKDFAGFTAWASSAPVIVTPSRLGGGKPPAALGENGLTDEETAVCKQMGISATALLETKKKNAA